MINCIIIEDQPPAQRILKKYIEDVNFLELIGVFTEPIQVMDFLKSKRVDLIFLDIHLPKISGIDFLKTVNNPPSVIITTAFTDYALESYEYNVIDYLLKPFSFQRFLKAVSKVSITNTSTSQTIEQNEDLFFIKSGYEHIKIIASDIVYIKSEADYTEVFTADKIHLTTFSLKYWIEKLNNELFIQVHKSYIVNTKTIVKISGNQIFLQYDFVIPIGRTYKDFFVNKYLK